MSDKVLACSLDLFRRLPPAQIENNLSFVAELLGDDPVADELLQSVDVPLSVETDPEVKKDFLKCDYNRDGDSYRSPYTNKYVPALPDGITPPDYLRKMEMEANDIFQMYCEQYFDGGLSSSYFWEVDKGFAACVLIKKDGSGQRGVDKGVWDSIHVMEVVPDEGSQTASYKLTTTIILTLTTKFLDLSGSVQKQSQKSKKFDKVNTHIVNMGNMIQEMENQLRDQLQTVYFDKAREITRTLRNPMPKGTRNLQKNMADELANALANKRR